MKSQVTWQDDVEMLTIGIFQEAERLPTRPELHDMFNRALKHRYEFAYPDLFLPGKQSDLDEFIFQIHVENVTLQRLKNNATYLSTGISDYIEAHLSGPVIQTEDETCTFQAEDNLANRTAVVDAVNRSVIDEILNSMFGQSYPELRYLKRYFIAFGWKDHAFLPLLISLPRTWIPVMLRQIAEQAGRSFEDDEYRKLEAGILEFLDNFTNAGI
ncbi:hypothetical protein CVT26_000326 [Gymnopilus dilepis]|uniref:Uncharacterized protein n=1 Tax=Gymnopilus dilepis TaxID=231916 RepID=A0A409VHH1_9AGAR|nr:hypothetical protein CVT26_000326 [Gymnopilus dilepis]